MNPGTKKTFWVTLCAGLLGGSLGFLFAQTYQELEDSFLRLVTQYRTEPGSLTASDLDELAAQMDDYLSRRASNLAPIERFTLPYYKGYLAYIKALLEPEPPERRRLLRVARNEFAGAVDQYDPAVQLPDKRAFARYMQGWCELRAFLAAPAPEDSVYLNRATRIFQSLLTQAEAAFIRPDVTFLLGLCAYLRAVEEYKQARVNQDRTNAAINFFAKDTSGAQDLHKLSKLYLAATKYLRGQQAGLTAVWQKEPDLTRGAVGLTDFQGARTILYRDLLENLTASDPFLLLVEFGSSLSYLQESSLEKRRIETTNVPLEGLDSPSREVLRMYMRLLALLQGEIQNIQDSRPTSGEAAFWWDLLKYQAYLQDERGIVRVPGHFFTSPAVEDWRAPYLTSLARFYRSEWNVLENRFEIAISPADTVYLPPFYRLRSKHLERLVELKRLFDNAAYDIATRQGFRDLLQFEPNLISRHFGRVFSQVPEREVLDFGRYLLALAGKNGRLYYPAYLSFEYLKQRNLGQVALNKTDLEFLQAFCELQVKEATAVLQRFSEARVNNLSPTYRNEAIYYRAIASRLLAGDLYSDAEIAELEKIERHHPEAGYIIAYKQNVLSVDEELLNIVCTQACEDREERFAEICAACNSPQIEFTPVENPPEIIVGNDAIRYERLLSLKSEFLKREREFIRAYWQAYSSPLLLATLGEGRGDAGCSINGPREFYLENAIEVSLVLGRPGVSKTVMVKNLSDPTDCRVFNTEFETVPLAVLALRPYQFTVAIAGHYPLVKEQIFRSQGERFKLDDYDQALQPFGNLTQEKKARVVVDAAGSYYIAANSDLRIYGPSGSLAVHEGFTPSAIERVGDTYYAVDRVRNRIRKFGSGEMLLPLEDFNEDLLNQPSDLASSDSVLYILNAGDNSVLKYRPGQGGTRLALDRQSFGRLESLEILGNTLFLSDWARRIIWNVNLSQPGLTPTPAEAFQTGEVELLVPGRLSRYRDRYLLVANLGRQTLYVFSRSGIYLDRWVIPGLLLPMSVDLDVEWSRLTVRQMEGVYELTLKANTEYRKDLSCEPGLTVTQQAVASGASRFCVPVLSQAN